MKPYAFFPALILTLTFFGSIACSADLVAQSEPLDDSSITEVSYADTLPTSSLDRSVSSVSVPEPATFGLISIAIALGGGLMIRRKAD